LNFYLPLLLVVSCTCHFLHTVTLFFSLKVPSIIDGFSSSWNSMYNKSVSPLSSLDVDIPDLAFSTQFEKDVITHLNVICNSISIFCGMIVLTVTAALRIYNKKLVDRVSLRLNAAVSATDVVNSIALLIYTFEDSEGNSCKFSAFLIIWLSNQYIFLTTVSGHLCQKKLYMEIYGGSDN
jgi:hypothetical protein